MSSKILLVDDDKNILAGFERNLRKRFSIETASSGAEAFAKLSSSGPFAVMVVDMQMPNMSGMDFLKLAEAKVPDTVRIMLTGNADQKTAVEAVNQGHVFRFLNKPCSPEALIVALEDAQKQHRLVVAERELLENTLNGAVKVLTDVLAAVDSQAFGRSRQLQSHLRGFLHSFNVSQSWELEMAAMLAPIGRVTLPPAVLMKARAKLSLTVEESDMLLRIPEIGAELLDQIPRLENVARIVRLQNKNFDGSGLPTMASGGDNIPIGARILKVLGDFTSLVETGLSKAAALHKLQQSSGCYDPVVLNAVCRFFDIAVNPVDESPRQSISVRVQDLNAGQTLADDVETTDSLLVAVAGTPLSLMLIERLRNFRQLGTIMNTVKVYAPNKTCGLADMPSPGPVSTGASVPV